MDEGKHKPIAIIVALIAPPLTWLYTYQRDAIRFWIGLLLSGIGFSSVPLAYIMNGLQPLALLLLNVVVLIWALGDTISKPNEWYVKYPNG